MCFSHFLPLLWQVQPPAHTKKKKEKKSTDLARSGVMRWMSGVFAAERHIGECRCADYREGVCFRERGSEAKERASSAERKDVRISKH